MYLPTVIDLFSRRVIGYSMAEHMRAVLVDALHSAVATRGGQVEGLISHCLHCNTDNAVPEARCAPLKRELPYGCRWATRGRARLDVFGWIAFYNTDRLHSTFGCAGPSASGT